MSKTMSSKDLTKYIYLLSTKPADLGVARQATIHNNLRCSNRRWQSHGVNHFISPHASPLSECSSPEHTKTNRTKNLLQRFSGVLQAFSRRLAEHLLFRKNRFLRFWYRYVSIPLIGEIKNKPARDWGGWKKSLSGLRFFCRHHTWDIINISA